MKRVAVIGGGMAGLTAAWQLTGPKCRDDIEVTVYQRGWRLGGKGASSRGRHGRIQEHGLHVWLGYYENAFRLMRRVYRELDRPTTDPSCVIPGFDQAFAPMHRVGIADTAESDWADWIAGFSPIGGSPGAGADRQGPSALRFIRRVLTLLADFAASLNDEDIDGMPPGPVVLSGSPDPPAGPPARPDRLIRLAEIGSMIAGLEVLRTFDGTARRSGLASAYLLDRIDAIRTDIFDRLGRDADSRRSRDFVDLLVTCVRGAIRDGLFMNPAGLAAVNDVEMREWLRSHGAAEQTCRQPLIKAMYDLGFAYRDGDFDRPGIAAGQGLLLTWKMFLEYRGALFWQMQAGMGDIVFAPLYQTLKARGVRFEFFHRLDQVHLSADGARVTALTFGRQATMRATHEEYRPLVRVAGLPCFPAEPDADQLVGGVPADSESHWSDRGTERPRRLTAGTDFDEVVLAVSIGMIPHTCPELLARSARWRAMVEHVATVPTQALQLWLTPTEDELGWPHVGSAVSGYPPPFDTYASMSHLIPREGWPDGQRPGSIAYFCSVLGGPGTDDPDLARKIVKANAVEFLDKRAGHFWPGARHPDGGFRRDLLHTDRAGGSDPLESQYWSANVDPSDRYVQCLPGTLAYRLRADGSGFGNLFLAGDWIDNGHNAGCIEAAVISGIQAANAVRARPLTKGMLGDYRPGTA
ncbi:MAG TPA: FAD-dependent oxidoreductase [Nakamurella sp.]